MVQEREDVPAEQADGLDERPDKREIGSKEPLAVTSENVARWAKDFKKFYGLGSSVRFYRNGSARGFILGRYWEGIYPVETLEDLK